MNRTHLLLSLLLLAILLLAAGLRLSWLDLAEFKADEAGIARQALALVHEGRFPLVGPGSSQGPAHPPLQIYLMALPFSITRDPRLAVVVIALIHLAAVGVTFLLGRRFFHHRVGVIAAFLLAVNPWAIYYARKIWTQNWPLATTLFMLSLLLLIVERRPWALAGAALALVALIGTHLGGLAFAGVLLVALPLFPARVERRPLLVAVLVLVLFAAPYVYYDATHGWSNLRGLFLPDDQPLQIDLQAVRFATWLSSGYHYQDLAGTQHAQFLASLPPLRWLDVLEMTLWAAGALYLVARVMSHVRHGRAYWRTSRHAARDVILLSWLLIPIALQTFHTRPVYPHYFIQLYPAQHLVIALLLSDVLSWLRSQGTARRRVRWTMGLTVLIVATILAIGAWQVYVQQRFMRFVTQHETPDGYGPVVGPLWQTARMASRAVSETTAPGEVEILVVAQGDDRVWDNIPAALDVLLPPDVPQRFVDGEEALAYPLRPSVYVVAPHLLEVAETLAGQRGTNFIDGMEAPGDQVYRVFQRSNASRDDVLAGMTPLDPPRRLDNGVELLAYEVVNPAPAQTGDALDFYLAWWLDGPPPKDVDYHFFAHLVDSQGERVGQHDLDSFPTGAWHTGDLVVTRFKIAPGVELSPGIYRVNVGMYTYPDVTPASVLDVAGNPAGTFRTIGPLELGGSR